MFNKIKISNYDELIICIDRSSSTYENNISLQIYASIFDFADILKNKIDISCFDTNILYPHYNLNKNELKVFADKYLKPLPPPPLKGIGKGTNLSIAIEFVTISMINKIKNNNRVIGIIFTDDESHLIKEDNIFLNAKNNCEKIKNNNCELIIIQMLPKNNYSSEKIIKKFNLNKNQVIFFNNDNPNNIYKIFSKSLELLGIAAMDG